MRKKLYLIDGANYLFRAFYAIRNLSNSKGFPTGALYGFTQMLLKLMRDEKPDLIAVCFDTPEPTFRDEMFESYKANRKAPPDDLVEQFPFVRPVVSALGIPMVERPGFEADDIIGTLAKKFSSKDCDVVIVSGDKDLMQMVGPNVSILDEMKGLRIGENEVIERFGVPPSKVVEVLGLAGDSSDNIPGVPGIGVKTATSLIQKYGTIEDVISNAGELKGSMSEKIKTHTQEALLSKKLVQIKTNIELDIDEAGLLPRGVDRENAQKIFGELEFTKLLSELAPKESLKRDGYRTIRDEKELSEVISAIKKSSVVSISLEATSFNPMDASISGFALSWKKDIAAYIPIGHENDLFAGQLGDKIVNDALKKIFEDASVKKVGHNLNYVLVILERMGFDVKGVEFDAMIASYVLDPGADHSLEALSQRYLDHRMIRYEEIAGKGRAEKNFAEIPPEDVRDFACEKASVSFLLAENFREEIKDEGLSKIFYELEMPLLNVLVDMEICGVKVDTGALKELSKYFGARLIELEKKICGLANFDFNINSPKQLGEVLFERLKLPGSKKTKTGFSTNQEVLEELSSEHEIAKLVLEYRSLSKLVGTYIDALPLLVNKRTGRIHTSFNQAVAATGRLSSSDPNLQNIPARGEDGIKIRKAFVAESGKVFISADYSQIELRVLAHMSKDESLLLAFGRGDDVHAITASGIFGVAPDKITDEQRAVGKTVNFATIYGQTPFGLSKQLGINVGEAASYIGGYFKKYPRVAEYRGEILSYARENGKVETLFGRRRFFSDIASKNAGLAAVAERMAFNTVFQGTAADIIKRAMVTIHAGLNEISKDARMILQVHDELIFEVPEGEVEKVKTFVTTQMEKAAELKVPLEVNVGTGKNWAEVG